METSARSCGRSAISAFEVAALVATGKLTSEDQRPRQRPLVPPPPVPPKPLMAGLTRVSPPVPPKPRRAMSQMALNNGKENFYSPEPIKHSDSTRNVLMAAPAMSPKLSFKTSRDRSSASLLSLNGGGGGGRTPKVPRKSSERTVTIKCQRLNAGSGEYEEVEVEVPGPIYETLRFYNGGEGKAAGRTTTTTSDFNKPQQHQPQQSSSMSSRIRSLFARS